MVKQLARQRIRYMVEFGGIYAHDEPASKTFVVKWLVITTLVQIAVHVMLR